MEVRREWIYLLLGLVMTFALIFPIGFKPVVSADAHRLYDSIQALPPRTIVWMGFDYYASTVAEIGPASEAILSHCFRQNLRVVITDTIPDGVAIASRTTRELALKYHKTYGEDYITLGYQPGDQLFVKQMTENVHATFATDVDGHPLDSLPLGREVHSAADVALIVSCTDNNTFEWFVQIAHTRFKTPVAGAVAAVMVPTFAVYLNSGQALAMLGGLRGGAEYEQLVGIEAGMGSKGLDAQSCVHVFIVLLIVVSNILYWRSRRR